MKPLLVKNLKKNIRPDGTDNYHLNCPFCNDKKQHLYVKGATKGLTIFKCWKCAKQGAFKNNSSVYSKILSYNNRASAAFSDIDVTTSYTHSNEEFDTILTLDKNLLDFLIVQRDFTLKQAIYIIKKFKIFYKNNRVYFSCFYFKKKQFSLFKDLTTGLYKNDKGSKFIFNFNAVNSPDNYVVLVEGVFDAIRLACYKIPAIALLGKAFGNTAYLLFCKHIGKKDIFIMLDGDIKENEDLKLLRQLKKNIQNNIYIIKIKESVDPDEYFRERQTIKNLKSTVISPRAKKISV